MNRPKPLSKSNLLDVCLDAGIAEAYRLRFAEHPDVSPFPLSMCLEITHRCNFNCSFCFNAWTKTSSRNEGLSTSEWFRIINDAADIGVRLVTLTGGEPTLRSDWKDIATFAMQKGLLVTMLTNGTRLTNDDLPVLRQLHTIQVSLVSTQPDLFSSVTGTSGQHERVMSVLKWLSKSDVRIATNRVLLPETRNDLGDHLQLMKTLRIGEVNFSLFLPVGAGFQRRASTLTKRQLNRCVGKIGTWSDRYQDVSVSFGGPLFPCLISSRRWRRKFAGRCACGRIFAMVDPWGHLRPCGSPFGPPGSLLKEGLLALWNHPYMQRFRDGEFLSENCKTCKHLEECGSCAGMCLAGIL